MIGGCGPASEQHAQYESLIEAAHAGNAEAVRRFLAKGSSPEEDDSHKDRGLYHAAWQGHLDVVELLLEHGADANYVDEEGLFSAETTVLHRAVQEGEPRIVGLLLEHGADPTARRSLPPYHEITPLHEAAIYGHVRVAEQLIAYGAAVNAGAYRADKMDEPITPLDIALDREDEQTANVLRQHGPAR